MTASTTLSRVPDTAADVGLGLPAGAITSAAYEWLDRRRTR